MIMLVLRWKFSCFKSMKITKISINSSKTSLLITSKILRSKRRRQRLSLPNQVPWMIRPKTNTIIIPISNLNSNSSLHHFILSSNNNNIKVNHLLICSSTSNRFKTDFLNHSYHKTRTTNSKININEMGFIQLKCHTS